MKGRRARTIVGALVFGAMVGFRDATGLAPPPPTLTTEVVEWLSPEPDEDEELIVVFEDPSPFTAADHTAARVQGRQGLVARTVAALRRLFRRTG